MAKRSRASRTNSADKKSFSKKSDHRKPPRSGPRKSYRDKDDNSSNSNVKKNFSRKFDESRPEGAFQKGARSSYRRKKFTSSLQGGHTKFDSADNSAKPSFDNRKKFRSGYSQPNAGKGAQGDYSGNSSRSGGEKKRSFEKKNFPRRENTGKGNLSTQLRRERPYKNPEERSESPRKKFNPSDLKRVDVGAAKEKSASRATGPHIEPPVSTGKIRLNKFIANSGVCSRREADDLITMGLISVNGKTITELGYKINPGDEVRHENKVLRAEKLVYILLNKPKGFLTTTSDPQERNTVMHLVANAVKERVYPVGRLDRNTTGLLLLTNDGDLADKLMHPSYNAKKIYRVELDRALTKADAQSILDGVNLEEGKAIVDDLAILSDDKKTVGLEIHIGWNRVVRRIFESLNYEVLKLDRSVYAGLDKKNLGRGEWRFLTKEELVRLKHYK